MRTGCYAPSLQSFNLASDDPGSCIRSSNCRASAIGWKAEQQPTVRKGSEQPFRRSYNFLMDQTGVIEALLMNDPLRLRALKVVAALDLPDCWIGAGFVRDAVWDHLHGYDVTNPRGDIDVIWYDATSSQADYDDHIEEKLRGEIPGLLWSVKNQARMHLRNGDAPYNSVADAMRHWPETATVVAARFGRSGSVEINAPPMVSMIYSH